MKPLKLTNSAHIIMQIYADRFEHINIIGSGSYGEVFRVKHRETNKYYAIKNYKKIFDNRVLALRTLR